VARHLAGLRDEHGIRYVNLLSAFFGYLAEPLLRGSLTLFAQEVIPRLGGKMPLQADRSRWLSSWCCPAALAPPQSPPRGR
jgi:hypothetical protein